MEILLLIIGAMFGMCAGFYFGIKVAKDIYKD